MLNVRRKKRRFRLLILCVSAREVTGRTVRRAGSLRSGDGGVASRQTRTEHARHRIDGDSSLEGKFSANRYRCGLRKLPYHVRVSTSTTRGHRSWQAGEVFTTADATDLYEVDRWGKGYFSISPAGHVLVHPTKDPARAIDLKQLTDHLMLRGIQLPVLIRFRDILRHRVGDIAHAFQAAIAQHQYEGRYVCVYPIKVNQQRQVVEEVLRFRA